MEVRSFHRIIKKGKKHNVIRALRQGAGERKTSSQFLSSSMKKMDDGQEGTFRFWKATSTAQHEGEVLTGGECCKGCFPSTKNTDNK